MKQNRSAHSEENEIHRINVIHKRVEEMPLDAFGAMMTEIQEDQPFLLSLLLGYQKQGRFNERQLDGLVKLFAVIWAYFREGKSGGVRPMEAADFEAKVQANNELLSTRSKEGAKGLSTFLESYAHRQLFTFVMVYVSQRLEFQPLLPDVRAALIYECKSVIDSLSAVVEESAQSEAD